MSEQSLKATVQRDLTAAMRERDQVRAGTLRMALTAISTEEVSGKEARELTDDEVRNVLAKEAKKREESAEAFEQAGRADQASSERSEAQVLRRYLPAQLGDEELTGVVREVIAEVAAELGEQPGMKQMGQVMKAANARVSGQAEGSRVAAIVKAQLSG